MTTPQTKEKRFKFIVSSAEEAVKVLHERLGENARVLSVRQVEGAGLARFLRAPKLEIIAEADSAPSQPEDNPIPVSSPAGMPQPEPETAESLASDPLTKVLQCGGINGTMLARLKSMDEWEAITRKPMRQSLTEIAVLLRREFQRNPKKQMGQCVAFVGTAGSGKTTALCKRLVMEVFFKQRQAVVLKLEMEKANPGDGLAVFCEVLGVPMIRSCSAIPEIAADQTLFIDFPGIAAESRDEITEMANILATLPASSRVLVVNAAYEVSLIKQAYKMGAALDASHVVFTHLDELTHWGKLWEFILGSQLTPLFFSSGQNIAGDFCESVFDAILERSFPLVGKENAMQRIAP